MSVVNLETISVRENLKDQETQQLAPVLEWSHGIPYSGRGKHRRIAHEYIRFRRSH